MRAFQFLRTFAVAAVMGIFVSAPLSAQNAAPKADDLLRQVRQGVTAESNKDMKGQIRKRNLKVPFSMSLRGDLIVFQYLVNNQWQRFDLQFKNSALDIRIQQSGKMVKLSEKSSADSIGGTDVSYDDLSMRFLYWTKGKILPQDSNSVVKGRTCWVVEVRNPSASTGQYAWMRIWIGQEDGALWQIDGYDRKGALIKRFILNSITKLKDGSWFFKQMKLEVRDPNTGRVVSTSYIEMDS